MSWQEEDGEEELVKLEDKERERAGTWKEWKKEEDQTVPSDAEWEEEEEQQDQEKEQEQEKEQVVPSCPTFSCQTVRLEELVFVATLGVGGFGRVELVTAGPDNTPFALKKLKKTQVEGRLRNWCHFNLDIGRSRTRSSSSTSSTRRRSCWAAGAPS